MLEWGTLEKFPGRKVRGVSVGHTQSRFFAVPQSAGPCRARQREHSVRDERSTWEGEGGTDTDLACSTSWSVAADAPSPGSSCAPALQLLPSACCCLQTCQQISLCMCFLARSRHHQPGSLQPLLPLPQLCRPASHGVKGVKLPPWLGGRQLLGRKWWPAAGDGTSFRRSRQTFWAVRVP